MQFLIKLLIKVLQSILRSIQFPQKLDILPFQSILLNVCLYYFFKLYHSTTLIKRLKCTQIKFIYVRIIPNNSLLCNRVIIYILTTSLQANRTWYGTERSRKPSIVEVAFTFLKISG